MQTISAEIPDESRLTRIGWTEERARRAPYVTWREDGPWIGDKRLVLKDQVQDVLKSEWRKVPPSVGYLRWYSVIARKYIGISRPTLQAFLNNAEGRQLFRERRNVVASRAIVVKKPGRVWAADISFPGGKSSESRYRGKKTVGLLTVIDTHSKLVWASPVSSLDMVEMVRMFEKFLDSLGDKAARVRVIRTDNGFGDEFTAWCREKGITHTRTQAWRPQSNGLVERAQRTINSMLMSQAIYRLGSKKRWPELVEQMVDLINNSWSRVLNAKPREVFDGQDGDPEVVARLEREGKKRKWSSLYDQALEPGDWVRVSLRASGPSAIKGKIKQGNYKGYLQQFSSDETTRVGEDAIRQVKRRIRPELYELTDGSKFDRADLLKVPGPDPLKG